MCKISNWKLRLWKWMAPEGVQDHFMWQAEHRLLRTVTNKHTVIHEGAVQRLWRHPDGSCDVVLTSGDRSATVQLPRGSEWMVLGNERACAHHYDTALHRDMQNVHGIGRGVWW